MTLWSDRGETIFKNGFQAQTVLVWKCVFFSFFFLQCCWRSFKSDSTCCLIAHKNVNACLPRSHCVIHIVCVCVCVRVWLHVWTSNCHEPPPPLTCLWENHHRCRLHHFTHQSPCAPLCFQTVHSSHTSRCLVWADPNQRWHGGTVFSAKGKKKSKKNSTKRHQQGADCRLWSTERQK